MKYTYSHPVARRLVFFFQALLFGEAKCRLFLYDVRSSTVLPIPAIKLTAVDIIIILQGWIVVAMVPEGSWIAIKKHSTVPYG